MHLQRSLWNANHLASTDNLTRTTNTQKAIVQKRNKTTHNERRHGTKRISRKAWDKTEQTENHVPWTCLAQHLPPVHYCCIHTEAVHHQGSSWSLRSPPSLSLTTKGSWMHLGEGCQGSRQPL